MELKGKVAVITQGVNEIGFGLASRFLAEGAIVVLSDANEKLLYKKAAEIGTHTIPCAPTGKSGIKNLIDKTTRQFGKIDLFVSNASFAWLRNCFLSEKELHRCWHSDLMSHMYAAKYVLPQMIGRGDGYLLNIVPAEGLLTEFCSEAYSTLKNPSLCFAERMAVNYKNDGINVSVLCSDCFITKSEDKLRNLVNLTVKGLKQNRFMISLLNEKSGPFYEKLYNVEMYRGVLA